MVIGGPDAGKSTFARFLYRRLASRSPGTAFLDGDPGQTVLGPPATMTIALAGRAAAGFPPGGRCWRWFAGAVTPRGHMLEVVIGARRLHDAARAAGAENIVYDTSGLVDPARGGTTLKLAKIDLLRPTTIYALQRDAEIEPLLTQLRLSRRVQVVVLRPSPAARHRSVAARQRHRLGGFRAYFAGARPLRFDWGRLGVFPRPWRHPAPDASVFGRIVSLEDAAGFVCALGLVLELDTSAGQVTLLTPLDRPDEVTALRLGDLRVDRETWRDHPIYGATT